VAEAAFSARDQRPTPRTHGVEATIQALLDEAGVTLSGPEPWDPQVHNPHLYARVLAQGSLGLGEAYMDGWWDC
jgi:cyclopropane-fatty-acyl-phospholipid synthase